MSFCKIYVANAKYVDIILKSESTLTFSFLSTSSQGGPL